MESFSIAFLTESYCIALQKVRSSYNLCGKLSPHTQSTASSVCFLLCEETTEFKRKKATQLLAKKLPKRTLLSKYESKSFQYIKTRSFFAANKKA